LYQRYNDMNGNMSIANGRLQVTRKITRTPCTVVFNAVLLGFIVSTILSINTASATNLYDLKAPVLSVFPAHSLVNSYRLNFRYREETGVSQRLFSKDEILGVKNFSRVELSSENALEQYDATIFYALAESQHSFLSKHQWLSVDLGVNFKFIEQTYEFSNEKQNGYRTHYGAYPMVSASALFDLPLSGMTASVEGSYFNYKTRALSEYRAKLTYQIDNVFGVSGGWEQQQYQLDATDNLKFDKEGPFVDLFYRF